LAHYIFPGTFACNFSIIKERPFGSCTDLAVDLPFLALEKLRFGHHSSEKRKVVACALVTDKTFKRVLHISELSSFVGYKLI